MDYRALFASTVKLATQIEFAAQIPEVVQRAFHIAMQGRPGPVAVALPEEMLTAWRRRTRRAPSRLDLAGLIANGRIAEDVVGVE